MILAEIPSPPIKSIQLGFFTVHFYSLCIIIGIFVAYLWASRRYARKGGDKDNLLYALLIALPCAIVGARLYHVLITEPQNYFGAGKNVWDIFNLSKGGLGIFGGLLFGAAVVIIFCKIRKIDFLVMADAIAPTIFVGQMFGRLGNWFNQELFGLPTDLPWGLSVDRSVVRNTMCGVDVICPANTLFHPTFLYEILLNGCFLIVLLVIEKKCVLKKGQALALYVIFYSIVRTISEQFRIDYSSLVLGLRVHIWVALFFLAVGIFLFVFFGRKSKKPAEA